MFIIKHEINVKKQNIFFCVQQKKESHTGLEQYSKQW